MALILDNEYLLYDIITFIVNVHYSAVTINQRVRTEKSSDQNAINYVAGYRLIDAFLCLRKVAKFCQPLESLRHHAYSRPNSFGCY